MSYTQSINIRDTSTDLAIAPSSLTGDITIAAAASRSGDITIGNAGQTTASAFVTSGSVDINAVGTGAAGDITIATTASDILLDAVGQSTIQSTLAGVVKSTAGSLVLEGASGTYVGSQTLESNTFIANAATTASVTIGASQTTGDISIGTGGARASGGNIVIGTQVAGVLAQINGGTVDINSGVDIDIDSGTTLNMDSGSTMLIHSTTTMDIQSSDTLTMTSTGAMILDSTSTNELNASTTTLVKGGTDLTLTANTGTLDMNANSGAVTLDSGTTTIITAGTTLDMTSAGEMDINTTGASHLYVEAAGSGTTYLGAGKNNTLTRIAQSATTQGVVMGGSQTSGTISIAGLAARTGAINIGSGTSNYNLSMRAGTAVIDTKVGTLDLISITDVDIDAVTNINLKNTTGGTITVGVESGRTGDITIGNAAATGSDVICKGVSMTPITASFAPILTDTTGNVLPQTGALGSYWKWGNQVTMSMYFNWTSKGSAVAGEVFKITALPFTWPALPSGTPALRIYGHADRYDWADATGTEHMAVASVAGETTMRAYKDATVLTIASLDTAGSFEMSCSFTLI